MAEWLGSGLQNRVQQFESAWYLSNKKPFKKYFHERFFILQKLVFYNSSKLTSVND